MLYKDYYNEIKNRIVCIIYSFCISIWISYKYKTTLLYLLIKPSLIYYSEKSFYFIYTNISELFYTYINLIITTAFQITIFYLIYQIFNFFNPGLYRNESSLLKKAIFVMWATWVSSILLIYNVVLPFSWEFFLKLQDKLEKNQIEFFFEAKLNEYLNFITTVFNTSMLYIFLIFLTFIYIYQLKNALEYLKKYRKKLYFIFFIIASIITPPDLISQITIGTSSIIIFEIYIYLLLLNNKLRQPVEAN